MEYHPICDIFPSMTEAEYKALCLDIAQNGLQVPITLWQDKILDGRHRQRACDEIGVLPKYQEWEGDNPLAYVISTNLHRRHLTYDQRVGIGLRLEAAYAEEAKKRMLAGNPAPNSEQGRAAEQAANEVNVGKTAIYEMKAVQQEKPDIADKLIAGKTTVRRERKGHKDRKKAAEVRSYTQQVITAPILQKNYNVIYADPPWDYGGSGILNAEACSHYSVMSLEDIKNYPNSIGLHIADDAILFLWVTNPFLEQSFEVIHSWGFAYKTNIVWRKTQLKRWGVGFYVRGQHELLLICTRGSFTPLNKNISPPISSVLEAPIREHSSKPDETYQIIETLYPGATYLELFSRHTRANWDHIGNEIDK